MFSWIITTIGTIAINIAKFYIQEAVVPVITSIGNKMIYTCLGVGF